MLGSSQNSQLLLGLGSGQAGRRRGPQPLLPPLSLMSVPWERDKSGLSQELRPSGLSRSRLDASCRCFKEAKDPRLPHLPVRTTPTHHGQISRGNASSLTQPKSLCSSFCLLVCCAPSQKSWRRTGDGGTCKHPEPVTGLHWREANTPDR